MPELPDDVRHFLRQPYVACSLTRRNCGCPIHLYQEKATNVSYRRIRPALDKAP